MKKIILFSPNGYVGGFIKERLHQETGVELYEMTRSSDFGQFKENYDVMIYSAAVSNASLEKYVQDNVMTALSVISFCRKHCVGRIIYLSSDSIYGELNTDVVTEKAIMVNPDLYGTTKYLAEKIVMESGIPYYILRMPGIVGRIWRKNFISNLMSEIKSNANIKLYNMDRKFNNIVDIDDLTRFIIILCNCEDKDNNEIFLLGNTERIELQEVVFYIKMLCHSTSQISNVETNEKRCFVLDVTKAIEYGYSSKKIKTIINELYLIQERMS